MKTLQIGARVAPELKAQLEQLAFSEGKTCSDIVKEMIVRRLAIENPGATETETDEPRSAPVDQALFWTLMDEAMLYREKLEKIREMMAAEKEQLSEVSDHLAAMHSACLRKLNELSGRMKHLMTVEEDFDWSGAEGEEPVECRRCGHSFYLPPDEEVAAEGEEGVDPAVVAVAEEPSVLRRFLTGNWGDGEGHVY